MTLADRRAPLIVLEGIDGSGKGTQAGRLHARLQSHQYRSELLSFPRYQSTFFGSRIGEFLNGELGTLEQLDPFLISLLYAGDRFESKETLITARQQTEAIVLDRYVPSNIAHQSAKKTDADREKLRRWIEHVEYDIFKLPRPDLVILLDIPVEQSQRLIRLKQQRSYTDQKTDLQEADMNYLGHVRETYLDLAQSQPDWVVIPVADGDTVRTVDSIADELWENVSSRFNFQ